MPLLNLKPNLSLADSALRDILNDFIYAAEQRLTGQFSAIGARFHPHTSREHALWIDTCVYNFVLAAERGHVDVVSYFVNHEALRPSVSRTDACRLALKMAAENGHEGVVRCLIPLHEILNDIKVTGTYALRHAAHNGHTAVVKHLLQIPALLRYADMNTPVFDVYIYPFVTERLADLSARQEDFRRCHPSGIFNIGESEFLFYFYLLKHLIRRNDDGLIDLIRLFLGLRTIARGLHQSGRRDNLTRFSLEVGNELVHEALLALPVLVVDDLPRPFAREDGLQMQRDARNHESSMRSFLPGEQRIIDAVKRHYQGKMHDMGGVNEVLGALKTYLRGRYEETPPSLRLTDQTLRLPFEWDAFTRIALSDAERRLALQAYYQHATHTAHRFLSNSNPWGAEDGWPSDYEYHIELIAYFWLAASDSESPATEGHTIAGRRDFFVKSLALIGRAHNWDHTRHKRDASGALMYDAHRRAIREEYDDLRGDDSSCSGGIALRLFQSVIGHPLFSHQLTKGVLQQELDERIHTYFVTLLARKTVTEKQAINQAIASVISLLERPSIRLKALDISSAQKQAWIDELSIKYGSAFDEAPGHLGLIYRQLDITPEEAHLTRFYTSHNLGPLIGLLPDPDDLGMEAEIPLPPTPPVLTVPVAAIDNHIVRRGRFNLMLASGVTCLDLSACGLSELEPAGMQQFFRQLSYIPTTITSINFSSNGFQGTDERARSAYRALRDALSFIPTSVTTLDLSGNGFERLMHKELSMLFSRVPKTVRLVSLREREFLSMTAQLERIDWPESYYKLAAEGLGNFMAIAKCVLDDYTKGGSAFKRALMLHWNRHYIGEVTAIVKKITNTVDKKVGLKYHHTDELMSDLARIEITTPKGSLARRYAFLSHHRSLLAPRDVAAPAARPAAVELEMAAMLVLR